MNTNRGIILALSAYIFWGLHPIYWKLLHSVPSVEIVANRVVWSFIFFSIIILFRKEWKGLIEKIKECENKTIIFAPAFLIGSNWFVYIWAVNAGFIIETSLGYFISPLISVFLGVFFLNESLRKMQWAAIGIAGTGVLVMTFLYGQFPWISLFLAGTWGTYGLLRKKSPLSSVEGLALETSILSIGCLSYLIYLTSTGHNSFFASPLITLLLIGTGIISGLPLFIYITSARMINLSLIGVLQYIYPTLLFFDGAFIYNEPINSVKLTGFIFIWIALIIYTIEGSFYLRRKKILAVEAET